MSGGLGWLIAMATFPGIILHEYAHKKACNLTNTKVEKISYLNSKGGFVEHGNPPSYKASFFISFAPLLINTLFALIFAWSITILGYGLHILVLTWLSISFGMHAFPSNQDVDNLWTFSKKTSRKILLLITLPFLLIIKLANLLRFIWFDLIFAIALFLIATNGIGFALISFSTGGGIDNINNSKAYIACNNIENESFCNEKSYEWCVNGTGYETACSKFKVCLEEQKDYTDCFDKFFYKTHKSD